MQMQGCPCIVASHEEQDRFLRYVFRQFVAYHPDTDARDYVSHATGERTFTDKQAREINRLTQEALAFDPDTFWGKAARAQRIALGWEA
jgi:hypothetical protein